MILNVAIIRSLLYRWSWIQTFAKTICSVSVFSENVISGREYLPEAIFLWQSVSILPRCLLPKKSKCLQRVSFRKQTNIVSTSLWSESVTLLHHRYKTQSHHYYLLDLAPPMQNYDTLIRLVWIFLLFHYATGKTAFRVDPRFDESWRIIVEYQKILGVAALHLVNIDNIFECSTPTHAVYF